MGAATAIAFPCRLKGRLYPGRQDLLGLRTCGALYACRMRRNGGSDRTSPGLSQSWCRLAHRRTAMTARLFGIVGFIIALAGAPQPLIAQEQITIFAAASLKNALDETNT